MAGEPYVIRKGVAADFFDKKIQGPPGSGKGLLTGSPIPMGLMQKMIGVGWSSPAHFVACWVDNGGSLAGQDNQLGFVKINNKDKDNPKKVNFNTDGGSAGNNFIVSLAGGVLLTGAGDKQTTAFVAVGSDKLGTDGVGLIYYSQNGDFWQQVFTLPNDGGDFGPEFADGAFCWIVTFDGTQFWAGGNKAANFTDPDDPSRDGTYTYDMLLSSRDGQSWSIVGQQVIPPSGGFDDHNGLIVPHLSKDVTSHGIGAPSGFYGKKVKSDGTSIIIRPASDFTVASFGGVFNLDNPGTTVTITGGKATSADVGFTVAGVAYGGTGTNLWLAVGPWDSHDQSSPGAAAFSTDDGQTWNQINDIDLSLQGPQHFMIGVAGVPEQFV